MSPTYAGYTCSSCGLFVPGGSSHYCSTMRWPISNSDAAMLRIAAVLERIAVALEARPPYGESRLAVCHDEQADA